MATSIHERGDGVPATLLRKKADPAQEWADGLPEVAEGETVTVSAKFKPAIKHASGCRKRVSRTWLDGCWLG